MRRLFSTPLGVFAIEGNDRAVTRLHFPEHVPVGYEVDAETSPVLEQAEREIVEYLAGKRREFTVPVDPEGRDFMRSVWNLLCAIPFGELTTYGEVAKAAGSPRAARAVGLACKHNPVPILIPCHRVIGSGGKLTGFSGGGVGMKQRLIDLEAGGLFKGV